MYNLNKLAAISMVAFSAGTIGIQVANAADATVVFSGSINDGVCDILAENQQITVPLGSIGKDTFSTTGEKSPFESFDVNLSNCDTGIPGAAKVNLRWDGSADTTNTELLLVSGGAQGVGVRVQYSDGTNIALNGDADTNKATDITDGSMTLSYQAAYEATGDTVVAGNANATAMLTLQYN